MDIFWSQKILLLEVIIQKQHLKIARHLENAEQKKMKTFIDEVEDISIAMPMYNLIEYSDIILIHLVVHGTLAETSSLKKMENSLILAQIIQHLLNTNQTLLASFQMVEEKME